MQSIRSERVGRVRLERTTRGLKARATVVRPGPAGAATCSQLRVSPLRLSDECAGVRVVPWRLLAQCERGRRPGRPRKTRWVVRRG